LWLSCIVVPLHDQAVQALVKFARVDAARADVLATAAASVAADEALENVAGEATVYGSCPTRASRAWIAS
jgi:hypothetical protein